MTYTGHHTFIASLQSKPNLYSVTHYHNHNKKCRFYYLTEQGSKSLDVPVDPSIICDKAVMLRNSVTCQFFNYPVKQFVRNFMKTLQIKSSSVLHTYRTVIISNRTTRHKLNNCSVIGTGMSTLICLALKLSFSLA
jgi:hypothetical protein